MKPIPTYIINLKKRSDRRKEVLKQFDGKEEFDVKIIEGKETWPGKIGLWYTIKEILKTCLANDKEFVLICHDDHQFTSHYNKDKLYKIIVEAKYRGMDIIYGGVRWFDDLNPISENLFWANTMDGMQFIIIFKRLFEAVLLEEIKNEFISYKMSSLAKKKAFIFPFISLQKDFGYSDVTGISVAGKLQSLFHSCSQRVSMLLQVKNYYNCVTNNSILLEPISEMENVKIPTYIINLPERSDRLQHIKDQFEGKIEFDVRIVNGCKSEIGAVGLWETIRLIVSQAIKESNEIIIICEDDHEFTANYSWPFLIKNIIGAKRQGTSFLSGGAEWFGHAIRISKNRYWVNMSGSTQFIVIFRKFFQKILDAQYDDTVMADVMISSLTTNRQLLYPYISVQKDFGYSDVTSAHNQVRGSQMAAFLNSMDRLSQLQKASDF